MASENQKKANVKNAQLSTGPITSAGKAKVAKNPLKHGIFTKELVINTGDGKEDINEYLAILEGLMADFLPQVMIESLLVEKIAVNYWRLKRVIRYEKGELMDRLDDFKTEFIQNNSKPLKHMSWDWEIPDEEFEEQVSLVRALTNPEADMITIEIALDYVASHHLEDEDEEPWEEKLDKARKFIQKLSLDEKEEMRVEVLEQEWEYFGEMKQVRNMKIKLDQISRIRSIPSPDELEKIIKYETALERSIFQNLAALQTLQKKRTKLGDSTE